MKISTNIITFILLLFLSTGKAIIYVDLNAAGNADGTSWTDAYTSIQNAIDTAVAGDEIYIAEGEYFESSEISISVALSLKGGFPTGGGEQDIDNHPTIINGNDTHRVINATHNSGQLMIQGLELKNGFLGNDIECFGAGINSTGDLVLFQTKVVDNKLSCNMSSGAGIYSVGGAITLNHSQVNGNKAELLNLTTSNPVNFAKGGGIFTLTGALNIINSQINNNLVYTEGFLFDRANAYGGGVYASGAINLINSWVQGNSGYTEVNGFGYISGGGVFSNGGTFTVINSAIISNHVLARGDSIDWVIESAGGGIINNGGTLILKNSLVADNGVAAEFHNKASASGAGIYGPATLENSILWNNNSLINGFEISASEHEGGALTASYSLIKEQNPAGVGNIDATLVGFDPLFVDAITGDFRLSIGSPLIDVGDSSFLPADEFDVDADGDVFETIPQDLDGMQREVNSTVDLGPFEAFDLIFRNDFEL